MGVEGEEPFASGGHDQSDAAEFETHTGEKRQHFPHHFAVADHAHDRFRDVQEGEGTEIPEVFFIRDELADQTAEKAGGGGGGHA
jgi:hypothetical protein